MMEVSYNYKDSIILFIDDINRIVLQNKKKLNLQMVQFNFINLYVF